MILQVVPPPPPNGWPHNSPFAPGPCMNCIPIDQGAIVLIAAGVILGIMMLLNRKKNKIKV